MTTHIGLARPRIIGGFVIAWVLAAVVVVGLLGMATPVGAEPPLNATQPAVDQVTVDQPTPDPLERYDDRLAATDDSSAGSTSGRRNPLYLVVVALAWGARLVFRRMGLVRQKG